MNTAHTNKLGESNGTYRNGEWIPLPRWGVYDYITNRTTWFSDDEAEAEELVSLLSKDGECVCLNDGLPPIWHCRRCGRRHFNGTSDYCGPCNRGE